MIKLYVLKNISSFGEDTRRCQLVSGSVEDNNAYAFKLIYILESNATPGQYFNQNRPNSYISRDQLLAITRGSFGLAVVVSSGFVGGLKKSRMDQPLRRVSTIHYISPEKTG